LRDAISKITREKWIGDVAQKVKCLLCKCEGLSLNPSPTKRKRKKRKYRWVVREGVGAGGRNEPSLVCTYE
jgi:hypothetical protein